MAVKGFINKKIIDDDFPDIIYGDFSKSKNPNQYDVKTVGFRLANIIAYCGYNDNDFADNVYEFTGKIFNGKISSKEDQYKLNYICETIIRFIVENQDEIFKRLKS